MLNHFSRTCLSLGGLAAAIALTLLFGPVRTTALAEDVPGLSDPRSPLVFPPLFRAEAAGMPIWVAISSGKLSRAGVPVSWDLKDVFHLDHTATFLDAMARVQLGRFSLRGYYEPRDFSGERHFQDDPTAPMALARFSYPGIRVGGDVDLAQWQLSRIGVSIDYDLLPPTFTEASETSEGFKMKGTRSLTVGIHGVYSPAGRYCGLSPMLQFRVRWPASGAELTDVMLAAGLKAPETVLGSLAWKVGYRHTVMEFGERGRTFDITLDGLFTELTYYY